MQVSTHRKAKLTCVVSRAEQSQPASGRQQNRGDGNGERANGTALSVLSNLKPGLKTISQLRKQHNPSSSLQLKSTHENSVTFLIC
jgi:hypothetical protein